jgi:hypothetical protein
VVQQIILKDNDTNGKYSTRRITMLSFLKKIFGSKPTEPTAAPYKVEGSEHFPFPKTVVEEKKPATKKPATKQPVAKKPVAKKPAVKKPQAPKA